MEVYVITDGKGWYWNGEDMASQFQDAKVFRHKDDARFAVGLSQGIAQFIHTYRASFVKSEAVDE